MTTEYEAWRNEYAASRLNTEKAMRDLLDAAKRVGVDLGEQAEREWLEHAFDRVMSPYHDAFSPWTNRSVTVSLDVLTRSRLTRVAGQHDMTASEFLAMLARARVGTLPGTITEIIPGEPGYAAPVAPSLWSRLRHWLAS